MANCNDKGCPCPPPITIPGLNGVDGVNGTDGTNGVDGATGLTGPAGADGTNGAVTSLTIIGTSGTSTLIGGVLNVPQYPGFVHYLGEEFEGGVIYYLYKDNLGVERGLIVNTAEQVLTSWQNPTSLTTGDRTEDGAFNTALMTNSDAANYVNALVDGGFNDWYLPSIDELSALWHSRLTTNKALRAGSFTLLSTTATYWSSTEYITSIAFYFSFGNGYADSDGKLNTFSVRAIRSF